MSLDERHPRSLLIHRTFEATPPHGDPIHGDVRLPAGEAPRAAVVVAHGFKGFKDWGFFPYLGERLARAGFAAVSFNFSLNGVHRSRPTEFTELDAFARNTVTRELDDLRWMLRVTARGDFLPAPPERVGLLGHSRGGGDAVLVARDGPLLDALVTWCAIATFDRWPDATKRQWRQEGRIHVLNARTGQQMPLDVALLEDFEANRSRYDVEVAAREVRCPWLIAHGADDESVPSEEAERLHRASGASELLVVPGTGHTFGAGHPFTAPTPELDRVVARSVEHFRRHLRNGS